jgi:hypothetical protein
METVKTVYIPVALGNEEKLVYLKCSILGCEVIYKINAMHLLWRATWILFSFYHVFARY